MEADVDTKGVWKPAIRSNGKCNSQREHKEHKETGNKDFTERGEVPVYECVYLLQIYIAMTTVMTSTKTNNRLKTLTLS